MKKYFCFFVLLATFFGTSAFSKDGIIIYGQSFSFSLTEPDGWHCECGGGPAIESIGANAALWRSGETFKTANPIIYLRVNPKGKGAADDMKFDMSETKKRVPTVEFKEVSFSMRSGKAASNIFSYKGGKAEYVTYFYPKGSNKHSLSITMHLDDRKPTEQEIKIYKEILGSVFWLTDDVAGKGKEKK